MEILLKIQHFLILFCIYSCITGIFVNNLASAECSKYQFKCSNGPCIDKAKRCDGIINCGDNSDEYMCMNRGRPKVRPKECFDAGYFTCDYGTKCIPNSWMCDEVNDCDDKSDESSRCDSYIDTNIEAGKMQRNLTNIILNQIKNDTNPIAWELNRLAVALYISYPKTFAIKNETGNKIAKEITINLLSRLALEKLEDIPSSELALYINALIVTCTNPRTFYNMDLVQQLRLQVDSQNYTNPIALIALCNAGDQITSNDTKQLESVFENSHQVFWTDIQALTVMAMACASKQEGSDVNLDKIKAYTQELKRKQQRNGSIENLKTTGLVLQALYASDMLPDEENFHKEKALKYIIKNREIAFNFLKNMQNFYYVLPALSYKSLINVKDDHCLKTSSNEEENLQKLLRIKGAKKQILYSLRIGENKEIERTLSVKVPIRYSLYNIVEFAAGIDSKYKFKFNIKDYKPYIYSLSGIQDDPEIDKFWFPYFLVYKGKNETLKSITKSFADITPENGQHLLYWYKTGKWIE